MLTHHFFERNRLTTARLYGFQAFLGQINVFQIVEVLQDSFAGIISFRPPGFLGKPREAFFDTFRKPNGKHGISLCYTIIALGFGKAHGMKIKLTLYGFLIGSAISAFAQERVPWPCADQVAIDGSPELSESVSRVRVSAGVTDGLAKNR